MSTSVLEYEVLLLEAITQAKAGAPQVAHDLRDYASRSAEAIAKVTDGAAALDLISLPSPDGSPPVFELLLRRVGHDGPQSDLGIYLTSEAGYPIRRWYSRGSWESNPNRHDQIYDNQSALDGHFRWMISSPSSRLVILVAFIMEQVKKVDGNATATS